jgi:pimeloyl-ACP methyl ester carboxylesterase
VRAKRAVILIGATAATAGVAVGVRQAVKSGAGSVVDPRTTGGEFTPVRPRAERTVRSADGTALHVAEYGPEHAPTVVLSHGWTCSIEYWTPVIRALSTDLRVIAYDLRGHGTSAAPGPAGFTTDALADDLAAVLTATVTEDAPAVVAGHSMGGMSLLALAGRHRDLLAKRVAAAIIASTGVSNLVVASGIQPGPLALRKATASAARAVLASTLPLGSRPTKATLPGIRYIALSKSATPEQVAFCAHIVMETPRHVRGGFGATLAALDLRVAVPHLDVPTVVIVGLSDRLTPPSHSRALAADLPRAELIELDGVGHMTPVEASNVVEKEIRRLVSEHATPPAPPAPSAPQASLAESAAPVAAAPMSAAPVTAAPAAAAPVGAAPVAAVPAAKVEPKPRRRRAAAPSTEAAPAKAAPAKAAPAKKATPPPSKAPTSAPAPASKTAAPAAKAPAVPAKRAPAAPAKKAQAAPAKKPAKVAPKTRRPEPKTEASKPSGASPKPVKAAPKTRPAPPKISDASEDQSDRSGNQKGVPPRNPGVRRGAASVEFRGPDDQA